MASSVLILIIFALIFAGINFLVTGNLITTIIIFAFGTLYFLIFDGKAIKKYHQRLKIYKQMYSFINTYIIALSVKENITSAYQLTFETMNDDFKNEMKGIEQQEVIEKLKYLQRYFEFDSYGLFISLLDIYQERGGDILNMSKYLTNQLRNDYNYVSTIDAMRYKKYIEVGLLWFITLIILVALRLTLKDFSNKILNQTVFYIGVVCFFIFAIISIDLLIKKSLKVEIKGWNNNEYKE